MGVPVHVVIETTGGAIVEITGGATIISGLKPGAVAADGTVASLKSGAATVLEVSRGTVVPTMELVSVGSATALEVSRGTALPTMELVSVGSAVLAREAATEEAARVEAASVEAARVEAAKEEKATEAGSVMVALGLQMLTPVVVPNGVVIGSGATTGGALTEG